MKTRGKEEGTARALALLIVINFHILPLFLEQHKGDGDDKTNI